LIPTWKKRVEKLRMRESKGKRKQYRKIVNSRKRKREREWNKEVGIKKRNMDGRKEKEE
jgi:hypothetical protein